MAPDPDLQVSSPVALQGTPFGEQNRRRLIAQYFGEKGAPNTARAWEHVYGMLLWVDRTTGLAHCYESDKCQPGRLWYARSLAFHHWLAGTLHSTPLDLGKGLDWMFQKALEDYLKELASEQQAQKDKGAQQRAVYSGQDFPLPGADPEIERIIGEALKPFFASQPQVEVFDAIADQLREYWKQENKRKNLLGEGFEDVLAAVVNAACGPEIKARTRTSIAEVAGFHGLGAKDKATKVDLIIESPKWPRPALVNVKWSIRADREDQLWDDFKEYVRFDRDQQGFDHYLVTNEFDPARLNAVCDRREANNFIFKQVVHINTDGVLAAYEPSSAPAAEAKTGKPARDSSMERVRQQVQQARLVSLSKWLDGLRAHG
jgi:hypothetical protein